MSVPSFRVVREDANGQILLTLREAIGEDEELVGSDNVTPQARDAEIRVGYGSLA
jgi:hypothetical protein